MLFSLKAVGTAFLFREDVMFYVLFLLFFVVPACLYQIHMRRVPGSSVFLCRYRYLMISSILIILLFCYWGGHHAAHFVRTTADASTLFSAVFVVSIGLLAFALWALFQLSIIAVLPAVLAFFFSVSMAVFLLSFWDNLLFCSVELMLFSVFCLLCLAVVYFRYCCRVANYFSELSTEVSFCVIRDR